MIACIHPGFKETTLFKLLASSVTRVDHESANYCKITRYETAILRNSIFNKSDQNYHFSSGLTVNNVLFFTTNLIGDFQLPILFHNFYMPQSPAKGWIHQFNLLLFHSIQVQAPAGPDLENTLSHEYFCCCCFWQPVQKQQVNVLLLLEIKYS